MRCGMGSSALWRGRDDSFMFSRGPEVYGTVTGTAADSSILVELEDGRQGCAEFDEITRQTNIRRDGVERMIGWRMGFLVGQTREDGRLMLSGRAFEEREYRKIADGFESRTRNIYQGRLVSVTADGKLAFYKLAQGVTGALHVSAFSLCRVYSFREIDLPRMLTVAVSGIDARGWLSLSAKPAFGDFEESVKRLGLTENVNVDGLVSGIMADGAAAVMLAPNLTLLTDASVRVNPGDWVQLRVRRVDFEQHRVKAQMLERLEGRARRFDYQAWVRPAEVLEAYVDLQRFDERVRLNRVQTVKEAVRDTEAELPDFSVAASRSPFSTYRNERIVREAHHSSRVQDIYFEARMGYLGEKHMKVASAVEALKYSSAWQIRRFLYLTEKMNVTERELKSIIDRLVKHDVIAVLRFQSDEGSLLTRVLHPSINFRAFCGKNPRNFGPKDFIESDASGVKTRLAANQLLIGLLHSVHGVQQPDTHPFLRCEETDVRVRPRHMITYDGKIRYLEAVRRGWEDEFLEKIRRYELLLGRVREDAGVIVVMEDSEQASAMAGRISEMRLSIPVWLTDDLSCLPEPVLTEVPAASVLGDVPAAAKALIQKIRQKIEDRG